MCWRNKWRGKSRSVEIIAQPENPITPQKLKTDELPIPVKMPPVPVMIISSHKKDADKPSPVKLLEIENKENSKINKKTKSIVSELNTLKDVPHSMPIIDVQHDKTKDDKFFASAELL